MIENCRDSSTESNLNASFAKIIKRLWALFSLLLFFSVCNAQNAEFTANITSGCAPLTVTFNDVSTGSPASWAWDFGNGNLSSLRNPSAIFTTPGTYTVKLTVTKGSQSDTEVKTGFIIVSDKPDVNFSFNQPPGCAPVNITFQDLTSPASGTITSWFWVFGDGGISTEKNPTHTFTSAGDQTITLKVRNQFGCENTKVKSPALVISGPVANFTPDNAFVCTVPSTIQFTNQSTGNSSLTYAWTFGDGKTSVGINPSNNYTQAGSYIVMLKTTDQQGCTVSHSATVNVGNMGGLDFLASTTTVCLGEAVDFSVQTGSSLSNINWNFGNLSTSTDPAKSIVYSTPGSYKVTLTALIQGNTCQSIATKIIDVLPAPEALFDFVIGCDGKATFNNTSTNSDRWRWDFGNGSISVEKSPVTTFTPPGDYKVKLVAYNELGCSKSVEKTVQAPSVPTAEFTPRNEQDCTEESLSGCTPFTPKFTNKSTSATAFTSRWTFGDGGASTDENPAPHTYNSGVFTVTLKVTNAAGCSSSASSKVTVASAKPIAKFRVDKPLVCAREEIELIDESTNANYWCWDFGDGEKAINKPAKHRYAKPGKYTVKLTAKNAGCSSTFEIVEAIEVKGPYVEFVQTKTCAKPYEITLNNLSEGYTSMEWNMGDGFKTNIDNIGSHQYTATGNYLVSLTASSTVTNCIITVAYPVTIRDLSADFKIGNIKPCRDTPVEFTDNSDFATSWQWDFGNQKKSTFQNATTTYDLPGIYAINLTVSDADGCSKTKTLSLDVLNIRGDFAYTAESNCNNLNVQFQNASYSNPSILTTTWDFGDGQQSTDANPSHTYNSLGAYAVKISLTNAEGTCAFTKTNAIVFTNPSPNFSVKYGNCIGDNIPIVNTSIDSYSFVWDFGNGTGSTSYSPQVTYRNTGLQSITLKAKDFYGCEKSITKKDIIVITKPGSLFTVDQPIIACPPLFAEFQYTPDGGTSFSWDFGNGQKSIDNNPNPQIAYAKPGNFDVTLIAKDANGCADTTTLKKLITVGGPIGNFGLASPRIYCSADTISFAATSLNTKTYQWDFGDGTVENSIIPTAEHAYNTNGTYNVALVLTDESGCQASANGNFKIDIQIPTKAGFSYQECVFEKEILTLQADANEASEELTFDWAINGARVGSGSVIEIPTDDGAGKRLVTLYATNASGCIYDTTRIVPVHGYLEMIPNIFTPNDSDDFNSRFEIKGVENSDWNLLVFNRWGKVVYQKNIYANNWNGGDYPGGVYYYYLENASCPTKKYKGPVTLMR